MHELSLMESALEMAQEQARSAGATRIHRITLRVGRLAGVEREALEFAFSVAAAGTMAEGAALHVEAEPIMCYCEACASTFAPADFIFACPRCGGLSRDVRAGQALELVQLEVSGDDE